MTKKILIIDNDTGFSTILAEGLNEHAEFSSAVVNSSPTALGLIKDKTVDMVIIDLGISDMPATKLIHAIREIKTALPIMVTPVIGQEVPADIQGLDIQGIVPKPFFVGDLPKIVGDGMGLMLESVVPELPAVEEPPAPQPRRRSRREAPPPRRSAPPPPPPPSSRGRESISSRRTRRAQMRAQGGHTEDPAFNGTDPGTPAMEVLEPTLPGYKLDHLRNNQDRIVELLDGMNQDFQAEVILLTAGSELIAMAGMMGNAQAQELAILVARGAHAAAQAASFLGERVGQFEQSLHEGNDFRLYSYSLGQGIVLSLAVRTNVPLGILRHQTRRTSQILIKDYII